MIGVALNSGNRGNTQRLISGNNFTEKQIKLIKDELTVTEKEFVNKIFEILDSLFPKTTETTLKLTGLRPKKVEGNYFPINPDLELSKVAKYRKSEKDLFQNVFKTTFVERGFTRARKGGQAPINLNVFDVIFNHVDDVIHFNSLAIPVRDVQKITKHPNFIQAISDTMGENVYKQIPSWLKDIANPQEMRASNVYEKIAMVLRQNSTAAILGHKISVSLLQAGSYTQTINEIGVKDSINGIIQFHKNRKKAQEFVYSHSPIMKNRSTRFDREVRDWLKTREAQRITKGRKDWAEILFSMIPLMSFR